MYIHHGPMVSYYAAKTRAYLGFKHISFVETHDFGAYRKHAAPAIGFTVFPVLESGKEILQDSTVIIDVLEARHPERPAFPADPVLMLLTRIVEFFIDELWVATAMHTRWNDPDATRFAISDFNLYFGRGEDTGPWSNGDVVARQMQGHLPSLGIDNEAGQHQIQRLFEETTQHLNNAVGVTRFAFGDHASLVDCCLFAGYFPHQYRDHGSAQRYLKTEAAALSYYIDKMQAAYSAPASGDLTLTDEFLNYLQYIGPIAAAYAISVKQLARPLVEATDPGEKLDLRLAPEIVLYGKPFRRNCGTFSAWKAQRVQDAYDRLSDNDSKKADELMTLIGWQDFLASPTTARIDRVGFELQRELHQD